MAFVIDLTREIDAPAELVWDVVSDLPRYPEWNPFCVTCESTLRPGDPIDMKVALLGRPQRQREWMREFTEGTGFSYTMRPVPGGTLSSRRSHTVTALGPARTRYRSYFRLAGWLHPVVAAVLGRRLRAGFGGMTDALARRAELLWAERESAAHGPADSGVNSAIQNSAVRVRFAGDGLTLAADAYGREGDPPVVLLHGGGQTRNAWGKAGETLAATGRYAVSVDLRGHGDSDWSPDGVYGIDNFAGDVRAVCRALSQPPVLVGASLGGLASLVAIGEADEPVAAGLVLVDVAPHLELAGVDPIRNFMSEGLNGFDELADAADAIARYLPHRPRPSNLDGLRKNLRQHDNGRWYWHWDPRFMENRGGIDGQAGLMDTDRFGKAAAALRVPTLLVRGRMSDVVSDESVRQLKELIPDATVVDVTGAGHMVAGDRNDAFNAAVVEFIDRIVPVPRRTP